MMTLFCGDTSRCICSFNYAFTSDHQPAAAAVDDDHYSDDDDYNDIIQQLYEIITVLTLH